MSWLMAGVGLALLLGPLFLVCLSAWHWKKWGWRKAFTPEPEHLPPAKRDTWQSLHREAYDQHRREPARHQPGPSGPPARIARARVSKRSPRK